MNEFTSYWVCPDCHERFGRGGDVPCHRVVSTNHMLGRLSMHSVLCPGFMRGAKLREVTPQRQTEMAELERKCVEQDQAHAAAKAAQRERYRQEQAEIRTYYAQSCANLANALQWFTAFVAALSHIDLPLALAADGGQACDSLRLAVRALQETTDNSKIHQDLVYWESHQRAGIAWSDHDHCLDAFLVIDETVGADPVTVNVSFPRWRIVNLLVEAAIKTATEQIVGVVT